MKKTVPSILLIFLCVIFLSGCNRSDGTKENTADDLNKANNVPAESESISAFENPDQEDSPDNAGQNETASAAESVTSSETPANEVSGPSNVLVVYFSRVGNTPFPDDVDVVSSASLNTRGDELVGNVQIMAETIADHTGGELFFIETEVTYPIDYKTTTQFATSEKNNAIRPAITSEVNDFTTYDVVFIGYPLWWGSLPMAVVSFLESYDFSGKTVIPFNSHGGSGQGSSLAEIEDICQGAAIKDGLAIHASDINNSENTILEWLKTLNIE